jgi:hypothetical protein
MIGLQMSYWEHNQILKCSRNSLGAIGEVIAARLLESSGYLVNLTHPSERRGDLRVVDRMTGDVIRLEVKTARQNSERRWCFTLYSRGKTDYRNADWVLILAVTACGEFVPYLLPITVLGNRSTLVISAPETYAGKWSPYRVTDGVIRLEMPQ